jgi:hypothetical protein
MKGENCQLKHYGYDSKGQKKQVCLGFIKGRCTYGLKCKFLHHAFDPATQTWREACVQHANYKCTRGDECSLLHVAARKTRNIVPQIKEAKYRAKQASSYPSAQRSMPDNLPHVHRMAVLREVIEKRTDTLLIRLDYAVGIDGMLGMLSWCGMESNMYDLVVPPAAAHELGLIRFTASEYAARFVEACDISRSVCLPAAQRLEVLLHELVYRSPNCDDHYMFVILDHGRQSMHLRVLDFLEKLRGELISSPASYPEHGRVIAEPRLKDCLNRPREAYDDAPNSDLGISLVHLQGRNVQRPHNSADRREM